MAKIGKITYLPMCRIYPNRLTTYYVSEFGRSHRQSHINSLNNLKDNTTNPDLSNNAKKRIRSAINWLYALSDDKTVLNPKNNKPYTFRLNFITLTLSGKQIHDDNYIKKHMLNRFLQVLREQYFVKSYVWKAESQKNGNIHFHITTNTYIHHKKLRDIWNSIQDKHGYLDNFFNKYGHKDANSTDIHAIKKVKNLAGYMATYMTKNPTYRKIEGRQWFLSSNLSKITGYEEIIDSGVSAEIAKLINETTSKYSKYDYSAILYADLFGVKECQYPKLFHCISELRSKYSATIN